MSLINDALKKAQKQRTGGDSPPLSSLPTVGGEPAAKIAKRDKPAGFNAQLRRLAIGAGGVLVVIVVGAFLAFRVLRHAPVVPAEKPGPPAKAASPAATPGPAADRTRHNPPADSPAITFTLPEVHEPAPATVSSITASAGSEPGPAAAVQSLPSTPAVTPKAGEPKPAAAPAKLDPKSINFIENLRIAGIRASATDSKVLMNDRVYRVGDIVEHNLGLKLTGITASSLTFVDEQGAVYTRDF